MVKEQDTTSLKLALARRVHVVEQHLLVTSINQLLHHPYTALSRFKLCLDKCFQSNCN
jgi:hypothetical protein